MAASWVHVQDGLYSYYWLPSTGETSWEDPEKPVVADAGRIAAAKLAKLAVEKLGADAAVQVEAAGTCAARMRRN